MGALILLLLVTTRRMHKEQQQAADIADQIWDNFDNSLAESTPSADAFLISLHETRSTPDAESGPLESFSAALLPPTPEPEERPVDVAAAKDANADSDDAFQNAIVLAEKQRQLEQLQLQLTDEQQIQRELKEKIAASGQERQLADRDDSEYQSQLQQLSDMQRQESELEERLQHKQLALAELQADLEESSETTANAERLLRSQESALVSLRQMTDEIQANAAAGTDQTVVEFTNATGTKRTPILINVTAEGFEFLPSGIRVTHQNMKETPDRYNPLVAGVLAINRHRNPNASNVQPYILLLVRPSGGSVFYSAKSAFQEFDLHWGYELLEQDHNIAAGNQDLQEAEVARVAVLKSLNKRFPDYNKYAAIKEQLVEELAAKNQTPTNHRSVTMLPDGTMILPGDQSAELQDMTDGQKRFYAGGHAPRRQPEAYAPGPEPFKEQVAATGQTTETENPFAVMADAEANAAAITDAAPFDFPSTMSDPANPFTQQPLAGAESQTAEAMENMPFGFPNAGGGDLADIGEIDHRKLLQKRRSLSDNLGVGGRQASEQAARQRAVELSDYRSPNATNLSRTDPREPTHWADSMTAKHGPASPPGGQAGDFSHTEASEPSSPASRTADGQSTNAVADASAAGTTTATPQTSERSDPTAQQQPGEAIAQNGQRRPQSGPTGPPNGAGGRGPASDEESFLRKFLQKVEEERAQHEADPMLVSMLNNARMQAENQSTPTKADNVTPLTSSPIPDFTWSSEIQQKRQSEQPAATAVRSTQHAPPTSVPSRQRAQVFYVIKVHVTRDQLSIGDFEPVDTQDWSSDQRLALTLQAISSTMDEVWSTVRKDAAPAVRFLVEPNAEDIQQELSKALASMNVPTRGITKTSSGITVEQFFTADGDTEQRQQLPAEPIEPARAETRRRTSI